MICLISHQVMGGDPLLKLIAVDWFKVDKAADRVALHSKCLVQVNYIFVSTFCLYQLGKIVTQNLI